jgi:dipeptidyl aminopeptidase/acylaminoacyl peptidase
VRRSHRAIPILFPVAFLALAGMGVVRSRMDAAEATGGRRPFRFDDLKSVVRPSDVQLSPDASKVAYVITRAEKSPYGDRTSIWLLDVASGSNEPFTSGKSDRMPRWSPDGHSIAFLSSREETPQIWKIGLRGGEARGVIEAGAGKSDGWKPGPITEFAWSPDGARIAFIAPAEPTEEKKKADKEKEHPTTVTASESPETLTQNTRTELFIAVVEVKTGRCERLTDGKTVPSALRWSPDGSQIAFAGRPSDVYVANAQNADDIYALTLSSKEVRKLGGERLTDQLPAWSPAGNAVAFISDDEPSVYESLRTVQIVDAKTGAKTVISGDFKKTSTRSPVRWSADGRVYFVANDHATVHVMSIDPKDKALRTVTPEDMYVRSYSLSRDGKTLAALFEDRNRPPEIYVGSPATGKYRKLTSLHPYLEQLALGSVEKVTWRSADDRFTVEGFLVKPPDFVAGRKYPLLLNVHGGPGSAYSNAFADLNFEGGYHTPPQIYAAEGYLVLMPNPRGDYSYSKEFTDAFIQNWGRGDVNNDDIGGVEALIRQGIADPDRVGIMGHSYGGYATAWAITQTKRFKAASLSDSPLNLISSYGQLYPDFVEFYDYFFGADPNKDPKLFIELSPLTHASQITTPLMIRVGNKSSDVKPGGMLSQGLELYAALKRRNVPVELVVNPQEGHGIVNIDTYRNYVERNVRWFNFWVLGKGEYKLDAGAADRKP